MTTTPSLPTRRLWKTIGLVRALATAVDLYTEVAFWAFEIAFADLDRGIRVHLVHIVAVDR